MSRKLLPVRGSNPVIKMLVIRYLTAEKQICVDQETHLWITYCSAFVTAYAFIPTGSPRYIHQSRKDAHYSYVWKWSGRALPWCSGLSAGAMQTQTMMSPAAAWPGQNCNSHQKATVGFPKTKHSKHSSITSVGIDVNERWLNCGICWWVFPQHQQPKVLRYWKRARTVYKIHFGVTVLNSGLYLRVGYIYI